MRWNNLTHDGNRMGMFFQSVVHTATTFLDVLEASHFVPRDVLCDPVISVVGDDDDDGH